MDQKKKTVYYLKEEPRVMPAVQTEFPIIKLIFPGVKGNERFTPAFQELVFWYYFKN